MQPRRFSKLLPLPEQVFWSLFILVWAALILAMTALLAGAPARAFNDGRYAQSKMSDWFKSLRDDVGIPCCDTADGTRLEDPDWEFDGTRYRVRIDGDWLAVPPSAVLSVANRVGYAVVWHVKDFDGQTRIRCFLPGSLT